MTDDTNRRDLLKAAATGAAVVAVSPAMTQAKLPGTPANPATKYSTTPFAEQRQKWPALQREMHPIPDCGEVTYRGSGKL